MKTSSRLSQFLTQFYGARKMKSQIHLNPVPSTQAIGIALKISHQVMRNMT